MEERATDSLLRVAAPVQHALEAGRGIVAFETTILSFGLPSPLNEQVADGCERIATENGATPASLALLDGEIRIGLTRDELLRFCHTNSRIQKVNLQNFAAVLHRHQPGALTVAASMQAASMAGIRVFATGGIGGVHRGYANVLDISSDLMALSRFPVATICAGAKSILDVSATLEALETLGVPVVGFGTGVFPLFHARESEHKLDVRLDDVGELAAYCLLHWQLSKSAVLVVTPIPEEHAIAREELDSWIAAALESAKSDGIRGKATTPYLLAQLQKLSGGRTLDANLALIYNNAKLGAQLAVALADVR